MLWNCEKRWNNREMILSKDEQIMATEISVPTLTGSTHYVLWKLQIQAWTVVTELSKEKQAVAVVFSLPENGKNEMK